MSQREVLEDPLPIPDEKIGDALLNQAANGECCLVNSLVGARFTIISKNGAKKGFGKKY